MKDMNGVGNGRDSRRERLPDADVPSEGLRILARMIARAYLRDRGSGDEASGSARQGEGEEQL